MTPPLLALRNIEKFYGQVRALNIGSLDFHQGERVAVVGANASGKSTLLRLLAGITRKTRGTVIRSAHMAGLRIGYVPQYGGINPDLTVAENLRAMARLYERPWRSGSTERRFVTLFDLEPFLDIPVRNLSGGYQKIAGIATVLSLEPEVLFLDEPLSGIDREHGVRVMDVIGDLAGEIDLLVTTGHEDGGIFGCNRHISMKAGQIS